MRVKIIVHSADEGGFWAEVPALPGCVTEGETWEELVANLREAVESCLRVPPGDYEPLGAGREEEIEL